MRKTTRGRRIIHVNQSKVVGFTLKVQHGSPGYIRMEHYKKFVEVEKPNYFHLGKMSTNKKKEHRAKLDLEAVKKAFLKADAIRTRNIAKEAFFSIIIPKVVRKSRMINRSKQYGQ